MSDPFEPAEVFWIDDPLTLELLGEPLRLELIETLSEPRSVTEVAEIIGVPRTRLYHHVKLLEEAGLIRVVETREVGAINERLYRVSAKSYRPSERMMAESVPKEQAEAVLTALFGATRADFVRAVDAGIAPLREGDGRRVSLARQLLMLTPRRLTEFVRDLEALIDSYDSGSEPDAIPVAVLHVVYPSTRKHP